MCAKYFPKSSFCTIEFWRETSGSSLAQRQKDALIVPNPRDNSRRGRISRETSGRLAYVGKTSPRVASVRLNTGKTSGSSLVQRQKDALMVPNPREDSWGGRISRETSRKLAYVENISPRVASVRSNTGETSDSSLVQPQKDALMVPHSNSRGDAFPERPLENWRMWKIFPQE